MAKVGATIAIIAAGVGAASMRPVLAVLLIPIAIVALPWGTQVLFRRRAGVIIGRIESAIFALGAVCAIPYAMYEWSNECGPEHIQIIGNTAIDNDSTCRALFFGTPILMGLCIFFGIVTGISTSALSFSLSKE